MGYKKDSNFVWADLSTYDVPASTSFYRKAFGWSAHDLGSGPVEANDQFGMEQVHYHVAMLNHTPAAGIFDMPPFFQKIKMPPFWMSYLAVDDLQSVVSRAKAVEGVIVDIEPTPFGDGMMALIRDPLGAGFTCYEGPSIDSKGDGREAVNGGVKVGHWAAQKSSTWRCKRGTSGGRSPTRVSRLQRRRSY